MPAVSFDDHAHVIPDGMAIRGMRRVRGWSRRLLVEAIGDASFRESGIRATITPNLLEHVEERNEAVPYETLCQIAAGLDRDPIELVASGATPPRSASRRRA